MHRPVSSSLAVTRTVRGPEEVRRWLRDDEDDDRDGYKETAGGHGAWLDASGSCGAEDDLGKSSLLFIIIHLLSCCKEAAALHAQMAVNQVQMISETSAWTEKAKAAQIQVGDDVEKLLKALEGLERENEAERDRERSERLAENLQWQALLQETEEQLGRVLQTRQRVQEEHLQRELEQARTVVESQVSGLDSVVARVEELLLHACHQMAGTESRARGARADNEQQGISCAHALGWKARARTLSAVRSRMLAQSRGLKRSVLTALRRRIDSKTRRALLGTRHQVRHCAQVLVLCLQEWQRCCKTTVVVSRRIRSRSLCSAREHFLCWRRSSKNERRRRVAVRRFTALRTKNNYKQGVEAWQAVTAHRRSLRRRLSMVPSSSRLSHHARACNCLSWIMDTWEEAVDARRRVKAEAQHTIVLSRTDQVKMWLLQLASNPFKIASYVQGASIAHWGLLARGGLQRERLRVREATSRLHALVVTHQARAALAHCRRALGVLAPARGGSLLWAQGCGGGRAGGRQIAGRIDASCQSAEDGNQGEEQGSGMGEGRGDGSTAGRGRGRQWKGQGVGGGGQVAEGRAVADSGERLEGFVRCWCQQTRTAKIQICRQVSVYLPALQVPLPRPPSSTLPSLSAFAGCGYEISQKARQR